MTINYVIPFAKKDIYKQLYLDEVMLAYDNLTKKITKLGVCGLTIDIKNKI